MARRRFYASPADIIGSLIRLSPDESHHLIRVLRLKPGNEVFVFDGLGNEYRCNFLGEAGSRAQLQIEELLLDAVESPLNLTLAQALAKGEKFDLIVQKATELGVTRIVPLATEHSDVKLSGEPADKRLQRWNRISLEALKQCGRRRLVEIASPMSLDEFLASLDGNKTGQLLTFSEKGGDRIQNALAGAAAELRVTALIGPEGGWSDSELAALNRAGAREVTLGSRILRTETASLIALTLLQHSLGDLSK